MAKILLVEDDKSLREIYGVRLETEGYQIVSAGDGEEALATAVKERPDLIISDVMMPKISGFDMLDILRSTAETKNVKIIMMTALSSDDQRARGESLGADRYLVKSQVGIEDVVRTVHDVLGDGTPGAAPASPNAFNASPTPAPAPAAAPAEPLPAAEPVQPAPAIANAPVAPSTSATAPAAPAAPIEPIAPVPATTPTPTPSEPPVINTPPDVAVAPAPTTAAEPAPQPFIPPAPTIPAPAPTPAPVALAPSTPLPEPTAPFSTPSPSSNADRIIHPISPQPDTAAPVDIAAQMNNELNQELSAAPATTTPPPPPASPLPPNPTV